MKKKKAKALQKLAAILPVAYTYRGHTEAAKLWEWCQLKEQNGKDSNVPDLPELTDENRNQMFTVKSVAIEQINHYRRLKSAWASGGTKAVQDYLNWLTGHQIAWAKLETDLQVEQVKAEISQLGKVGAGSFWSSLLNFLYSFLAVFAGKKK